MNIFCVFCLYHYYCSLLLLFTPVPFRFTCQLNLIYLFFDTTMTSSAVDGVVLGGHELTRHVQSCLNRRMALLLDPRLHAEQASALGAGHQAFPEWGVELQGSFRTFSSACKESVLKWSVNQAFNNQESWPSAATLWRVIAPLLPSHWPQAAPPLPVSSVG